MRQVAAFLCLVLLCTPEVGGQSGQQLIFNNLLNNPLRPGCFHPLCNLIVRIAAVQNSGNMYGYSVWNFGYQWINFFLGIPYAQPPTPQYNLRFQPPRPPQQFYQWYDATYYRPACPQVQVDTNYTTNEDCLYLNIAVPNNSLNTQQPSWANYFYPIVVIFHGGGHMTGASNQIPLYPLVTFNIMVITVNYRLGALGFLSLENSYAPGNYGLLDQVQALQYIKDTIYDYRGDNTKVTLLGIESGACDAALHSMSALSGLLPGQALFNQLILMGGSDLTEDCFRHNRTEARAYASELAFKIGCSYSDDNSLLLCLKQRSADEIAGAAAETPNIYGMRGVPWAACIDGTFITDFPINLRQQGQFAQIKTIGGVTWDQGASYVLDVPSVANNTVSTFDFRQKLYSTVYPLFPKDIERVIDSIAFDYVYWPAPDNSSWRLQMLRDVYSDFKIGAGVDQSLKYVASYPPGNNNTQMYVFRYRSPQDPKTEYLGAYGGSELQYLFGFPYMNTSMFQQMNITSPVLGNYTDLDRNVSQYMMWMWSNFVKYGNATPMQYRNMTWDLFRPNNLTYLLIDLSYWSAVYFDIRQLFRQYLDLYDYGVRDFQLLQNFRQYHYAYWRTYFPVLLQKPIIWSTYPPTPSNLAAYQISTYSLTAFLCVILLTIIAIFIAIWRLRKRML